jgi:plastocyanin
VRLARLAKGALALAVVLGAPALLVACGDDDDAASGDTTVVEQPDVSTTTTPDANGVTIVIDDVKFTTPDVTIAAGESVTFDNQDNQAHTATGDDSSFKTDTIRPGESKTVTFDEPGTYPFICSFHPFMKGTVTVE